MGEAWMVRAWLGWFRGRELVGDNTSAWGWGVTAPPEGQGWIGKANMDLHVWNWNGEGKSQGLGYGSLTWSWNRSRGFKRYWERWLERAWGQWLKKGTMHLQDYNTICIIQYPLATTSNREIPVWVCSFENIYLFCIPSWLGGKFRAYLLGEIPVK